MKKESVYHLSDTPYAFPIKKNTLRLRLRTAKNDLAGCIVLYKDRYARGKEFLSLPLVLICRTEMFDFYGADITLETSRFLYIFRLEDKGGNIFYYDERGFWDNMSKPSGAFQFPYIHTADIYRPVKWAQEGICYQIFPQSFCNGSKLNDPEGVSPWGTEPKYRTFYGGDLQGIIDRLPYLSELGVTFLYLTPIFLSTSPHKYNTDDYYKIDPHFGDAETLAKLVSMCHNLGIKVILDAVFNHCGENFFAFQDVVKNGEKSRYRDWFFIDRFPVDKENVNYITFSNRLRNMPKLNTSNPEVISYLLKAAGYWMKKAKIDGWRLDVCDEVSHVFWKKFRQYVKSINSDAIIIGEIYHQSSAFLRGDEVDGIMNYPLREAVLDFFAERSIDGVRFADEIASKRMLYPDSINRSMLNLIDSHDTERFLTSCGGRVERLKLAEVFQFTYIGIPYFYYGDEVGLDGGKDPGCRKCMIWEPDRQNTGLLKFYKKLIKIRKSNKALVYGGYRQISAAGLFVFERMLEGDRIVVFLNNSDSVVRLNSSALFGKYTDLWMDKTITLGAGTVFQPDTFKILRPAD